MNKFSFLILVVGTTACIGKGVKVINVDESGKLYEAKCNGTARNMGDCYEQALETCPNGYTEAGKDGDRVYAVNQSGLMGSVSRALYFRCK